MRNAQFAGQVINQYLEVSQVINQYLAVSQVIDQYLAVSQVIDQYLAVSQVIDQYLAVSQVIDQLSSKVSVMINLYFLDLPSCHSVVGRRGGWQEVGLSDSCLQPQGVIIHELLHVLGLWHEQSRQDRDSYIEVLWDNIMKGESTSRLSLSSLVDRTGTATSGADG